MKIEKMNRKPWGWEFDGLTVAKDKMYCNDVNFYWERHPHGMKPWIIYNELGALGLVWANHEQDAMDEAVDLGLLDSHLIKDKDLKDYLDKNGEEDERVARLGNASEPFDQTYLGLKQVNTKDFPPELIAAFAEARGARIDTLDDL